MLKHTAAFLCFRQVLNFQSLYSGDHFSSANLKHTGAFRVDSYRIHNFQSLYCNEHRFLVCERCILGFSFSFPPGMLHQKWAGYISSQLQVLTQALGVSPRKAATLRTMCVVLVVHKPMDTITGAGPTAGGEYHTVLVSRVTRNI